jgi:hypothetical protein
MESSSGQTNTLPRPPLFTEIIAPLRCVPGYNPVGERSPQDNKISLPFSEKISIFRNIPKYNCN